MYYDNHNTECDGTECVTYECALLNRDESPEVAAVIALWDREGGWIPGCSREALATALGVPSERLRTAQELRKPTWHVRINFDGTQVSQDYDTLDAAVQICRAFNTDNPGGLYGVYDHTGKRV